ncbi:hypothetical protein HZS61_010423 [Fusarium oxysporum f. sp. conglutinans]|uniref:Uncharacterized protein n=1 Tax=Fusarium oxysporum f. sp. conglutinans TaxID=100902 RepID=A0A8H6H096_FUSOX|nr:hypothetical protein HZS61_010423 [Fusarium oxysporum f. sp. conglutinans]
MALTLVSSAPLAVSQNTPNENLILADCGIGLGENGGSTSREAIYYNGDVWTGQGENTYKPTMMVNIPWSGHYPWTQPGGLGFTLPNGDEFAVLIDSVPVGRWQMVLKRPDPPKLKPQELEIHGSVNKDTVEIYNIPASKIMNTARKAFLKDSYMCDTTKQAINGKCTISWKCQGDPATEALEKMAKVFDELATNKDFSTEREVVTDVCRQPDTRPGHEGQCRLYEQKVDRYYKMPGSMDLTMRNKARPETGENSSVHGTLEYQIECETTAWDCFFCNSAGIILSAQWPWIGAPVLIKCLKC